MILKQILSQYGINMCLRIGIFSTYKSFTVFLSNVI